MIKPGSPNPYYTGNQAAGLRSLYSQKNSWEDKAMLKK